MYTGCHLAARPYHTEYIHQIEEGQQESSCSGAEQYCLPSNPSKEDLMAWVVSALPVPEPPESESLQVRDDMHPDLQIKKLTVRQRHGKLFGELNLSGLDSWGPELADAAHQLLAKYHDVFSLDLAEL